MKNPKLNKFLKQQTVVLTRFTSSFLHEDICMESSGTSQVAACLRCSAELDYRSAPMLVSCWLRLGV